ARCGCSSVVVVSASAACCIYGAPPAPSVLAFPTRRSSDLSDERLASPHDERLREIHPTAGARDGGRQQPETLARDGVDLEDRHTDRKSTRLNSSHRTSSYAVFCLKKKNQHIHARAKPGLSL